MATTGLDKLYYAKITEDESGIETYAEPKPLAKAIKADLSIDVAEAILYADDSAQEVVREFKSGKLSLGIDDIGVTVAEDLTGAVVDDNGVLISSSEDTAPPVAVGFRARKSTGSYKYYWLYKVKFGVPAANLQTKGDSISFQTPTIEGVIMRRNKPNQRDEHPWKVEADADNIKANSKVIEEWFTKVYEPEITVTVSE